MTPTLPFDIYSIMKKFSAFTLLLLALAACDNDDDDNDDGPTGNNSITVAEESRVLLFTGLDNTNEASVTFQDVMLKSRDAYPGLVNNISLVDSSLSDLGQAIADSVILAFGFGQPPYFRLNNLESDAAGVLTDPFTLTARKPIVSLNQNITTNDSAWMVDIKVKFFKDTAKAKFRIQTYLVGNVTAEANPGLGYDVTQDGSTLVVTNGDKTVWNYDVKNVDSTLTLVTKGSDYVHQHILLDYFNVTPMGKPLDSYWPFGEDYIANDVIGTKDTPILHYFLKPDQPFTTYPQYDFVPEFVTVLWLQDPMTGSWLYINSVQSTLPENATP